jgi:hypothetical protein
MIVIWLIGFFILLSIFAMITSKLNHKAKCTHEWEDEGAGVMKCSKCNKRIHLEHPFENEQAAA